MKVRENFLTIPDAPRYEINSQLICRVKATGQVLKLQNDCKNFRHYSLRRPDKRGTFKRSPKTLRAQAVEAANPKASFEPIPSLGYKYEIDNRGNVRNATSKQLLKPKAQGKSVEIRLGDRRYVSLSIADLLWEVHGIVKENRFRPVPCAAENKRGKFFFPNLMACARFLAPKCFFSVKTVAGYLYRRAKALAEWTVTYFENDLANVKWDADGLSGIARRQKKLDEALAGKRKEAP